MTFANEVKKISAIFLRHLSPFKAVFCNKRAEWFMLQLAEWTESLKIIIFYSHSKFWFTELNELNLHMK